MAGRYMTIRDATCRDDDFTARRFSSWTIGMSTFERCRFDNIRATTVNLGVGPVPTVFRDCSFDGARFTRTMLGLLRFERCTFRNVVMRKWISNDSDFVDCVFSGDFTELTIAGSGDKPNEITGNDFRDAVMLGGGFRAGVDLDKQRLPTDPRHVLIPDPGATLPAALAAARAWADPEARINAESALLVLDEDYRHGQPQLLLCPFDKGGAREASNARLLDLVRDLVTKDNR